MPSKKKNKRSKGVIKMNLPLLNNFLSKIYLNGCMIDCILDFSFENNEIFSTVKCEDDDLFLSCRMKDCFEGSLTETILPIGDLSLFRRSVLAFTGGENDFIKISIDKNKIIIKSKGRGQINYLLSEKETIVTVSEEWNRKLIKKIKKESNCKLKLKESVAKNLVTYLNLLNIEMVKLKISGNKVYLIGGNDTEHQFKLPIGKVDKGKDDFENYYRSKYLVQIIGVIDFMNGDPRFAFSKDGAIVISQFDGDDIWAISYYDTGNMIDDSDDDVPF